MVGIRRLILGGIGVYLSVLVVALLYFYIRRPGHGAISQLLPALLCMLSAMLATIVGSCIGAYQLVTVPTTRSRVNITVVVAGFVAGGTWFIMSLFG